MIPQRLEMAKKLKTEHGDKKLGDVQVSHVFGGMRGLKAMLWDPSVLDSEEGIRFWGRTIAECQQVLPSAKDGKEMLPESMFWYLLTGKVPSEKQIEAFQADLAERSTKVPKFVEQLIDSFRKLFVACSTRLYFNLQANHVTRSSL
jgi:citrate synthase